MLGQIFLYAGESVGESMFIGLANGLIITVVYFLIRYYRNQKKAKEIVAQLRESKIKGQDKVVSPKTSYYNDSEDYDNLFEELKTKCHPKQFMEPYDHEKVKVANELYARILKAKDDTKRLEELRNEAMGKLGVKFSSKRLYEKLMRMTNPANFMNPYDAEKVAIANDYYQKVQQNAGDVVKLEAIWKEVKEKIVFLSDDPIMSPRINTGDNESSKGESFVYIVTLLVVAIIIIILMVNFIVSTLN